MDLAFILIALVMGITMHEFAHALMGHYLGDDTARLQGRLSLNPFKHIDPFMTVILPLFLIVLKSPILFAAAKPVPFNPWAVRFGKWGAVMVALAGPATNFILAVFFAVWLHVFAVPQSMAGLFVALVSVNIALGVFNLIPFPPLDGSRLLYAVAPEGLRDIMERIEQAGMAAVFLFLLVFYPLIQPFVTSIMRAMMNVLIPGVTQL